MDEFPDPEDEYELLHQDELELLNNHEEDFDLPYFPPKKSRVSLNFNDNESTKDKPRSNDCIDTNAENIKRKSSELDLEGIEELEPPLKRSRVSSTDVERSTAATCPAFKKYGVTSLRFPQWNFLTVNTDFGERMYVRLRNLDPVETIDESQWKTRQGRVSEAFWKIKEKAIKNLQGPEIDKENSEADAEVIIDETVEKSDLWVDKFRPKKYLELLSDEGVNRTLLNWIHMWDKMVFNKERVIKLTKAIKNEKKINNATFKPFKGKQQLHEEKSSEYDQDGRPWYKIALLCGSPGIGKTTLAHVVAILAGYNVIEVNASDDRSVESFRTTLENATQMQSVLGDRKPNCLILDEIDGAPTASIDFLLKFVNGKVTEKAKKGQKEKTKKIVRRPVICICNELYTPSLRQLRQQAYVVHFPQTSSAKLAQRLLEICKKQGMKTDLSTMVLLCEKAQRDIRSCITTLHFFKTRRQKTFRASDVAKSSVGLKDFQKNLFSVWQEIFQKNVRRDKEFNLVREVVVENDVKDYNPEQMQRLQRIVQTVQSSGDYDKLYEGVYENMLKLRYPRFQSSVLNGTEWFSWVDLLSTSIRSSQNFTLMPYLPYAFAAWHFLFSTPQWPKIAYPSSGYENHVKSTKNTQIITDILRGLHPRMRAHAQRNSLLLDVLPLLPPILTPTLRPVNATLFNEKEKKEFAHLLDVMLDFNMNYIQQRAPDGTYFYTFDPSFQEVTHFELKDRHKTNEFSYNMKQLISREVELERLRRNDPSYNSAATSPKKAPVPVSGKPSGKEPVIKPPPKPKPIDNFPPGQYKDFFGRIVQVERKNKSRNGIDENNFIKSKLWYCFKEGFNNAVKKDLTIEDLL